MSDEEDLPASPSQASVRDQSHATSTTDSTVIELQTAVRTLETLRRDNAALERRLAESQAERRKAESSWASSAAEVEALRRDNAAIIAEHQGAMDALWKQLREQKGAFDRLRGTAVHPSDLEVLRAKVLEEAEGKWKGRMEAAQQLSEQHHEALRALRRDYESVKTRMEAMALRHAEELRRRDAQEAAEASRRDLELERLQEESRELRATAGQAAAVAAELDELRKVAAEARREAGAARAERARSVGELEDVVMRLRQAGRAAERREADLTKQLRERGERLAATQTELAEAVRAGEVAQDQLQEARREADAAVSKAAAAKAQLEQRLLVKERQMAELQSRMQRELSQSSDKVLEMQRRLDDAERMRREVAADSERRTEAAVTAARGELLRRVRELEVDREDLGARAAAALKRVDEATAAHRARESALTDQITELQAQLADRSASLESEQRRAADAARDVEHLRHRLANVDEQLQEARAELDREMRLNADLSSQVKHLRVEVAEHTTRLAAMGADNDDLRETLQKEQQRHAQQTESLQRSFEIEKAAITKRFQSSVERVVSSYRAKVQSLKSRLAATKDMMMEASSEKQALTDRVAELEGRLRELQTMGATSEWRAATLMHGEDIEATADQRIAEIREKIRALRGRQDQYMAHRS